MTSGVTASPVGRRGALRDYVANTIYLVTGGVLLFAPPAGGFILATVIIGAVLLTSSHANLSASDIVAARVSLIILASLIGLAIVILCCFLGRLHRSRANDLLLAYTPKPRRRRRGWKHVLALGFTPYALRSIAYQIIGVLWGPVMITIVLICLVGSPAVLVYLANSSAGLPSVTIMLMIAVTMLILASPWIFHAVVTVDLGLVRWVNGVSEKALLAQRVQQVTQARSGMVAAADAERRRIERNLHDGAQQRLTALTVKLGIAQSRHKQAAASGEPVDASQTQSTLAYAQDEVQTALQEIRHLVRGLHPAVLEDRGLDAALSGIASRATLPIDVTVDVGPRPSLDVESVAYFVVSEAVNNIIAHAEAEHATVLVQRSGDTLHIVVEDDGVGGAAERRGTGLSGLRQRVESIDGTIHITSEPTQGTQIRVELPCE